MRSDKILMVSKFLFISILLIFLVNFFGLPSLERYLEKSTVFVDEKVDYDFDNPPSLLVSRGNKKSAELIEQCLSLNESYEAAVQCIDDKLPTKEQIILEEGTTNVQGVFKPTSLGLWRMDFDESLWLGKMYILEKYYLEPNEWLYLTFPNERIAIEFIDPKFYFRVYKSMTIPKLKLFVQPEKLSYLEIVAERFHLLDRPSNPCIRSEEYSFSKCVEVNFFSCLSTNGILQTTVPTIYFKDHVKRQVGCLHPWNPPFTNGSTLPACRSIQELRAYQKISSYLASLGQKDMVNETNCQVPCRYTKYSLATAISTFERYKKCI